MNKSLISVKKVKEFVLPHEERGNRSIGNASYSIVYHERDNKDDINVSPVSWGNACYGGCGYRKDVNYDGALAFISYHADATRVPKGELTNQHLPAYYKWLLQKSPYRSVFITTDVRYCSYNVLIAKPNVNIGLMFSGLVAGRYIQEYPDFVYTWGELVARGVEPNLAFVAAHIRYLSPTKINGEEVLGNNNLLGQHHGIFDIDITDGFIRKFCIEGSVGEGFGGPFTRERTVNHLHRTNSNHILDEGVKGRDDYTIKKGVQQLVSNSQQLMQIKVPWGGYETISALPSTFFDTYADHLKQINLEG